MNILLYVISVMVGHFDCKCSCLIEKNVPMAFILTNRWQDGAESLGIESDKLTTYVDVVHIVESFVTKMTPPALIG